MALSKSRVVSAIRGAFVADAASMGTHWIYNPKEMAEAVPSVEEPEFKNPPTPSFYSSEEFKGHYGPGMLSPYGEQLLFVTECLIESGGSIDGSKLTEKLFQWADKDYTGRKDHALGLVIENVKAGKTFPESGADDNQAHCYMKVVPVVCLNAGKPDLKEKVENAIRVHQNNDQAVGFGWAAAQILERALLSGEFPDSAFVESTLTEDAKNSWEKAAAFNDFEQLLLTISHEIMKGKEDSPFYDFAGRSCAMPAAFTAPCYLFQNEPDYATAIRKNILGSGDTCSRAVFLGAVFAAAKGGPPQEWMDKVDSDLMKRVDAAANKIADLVGAV